MKKILPILVSALLISLHLTGCKTKGPPVKSGFDIVLEVDSSIKSARGEAPSVEVHVLALDASEGMKLQKFSMTEYWNPQRMDDRLLKSRLYFGPGKPDLQSLDSTDPIWKRWQQQMGPLDSLWLFVLADLKGGWDDKEGSADPRRIILPLRSEVWPQHRRIHITMRRDGMVNLTPRADAK
jgi:hypothetical protein